MGGKEGVSGFSSRAVHILASSGTSDIQLVAISPLIKSRASGSCSVTSSSSEGSGGMGGAPPEPPQPPGGVTPCHPG